MKYLLALLLLWGSMAHATQPILVWGTKYHYDHTDFTTLTSGDGRFVLGYTTNIAVLVDEYDDFIGDYPVLTFDLSAEITSDGVPYPVPFSMAAYCQNQGTVTEYLGTSEGILIAKYGRVLPARMNVFNRVKTDGGCKSLKVELLFGAVVDNPEQIIKSVKFDALVLSDAM